MSGNYPELVRAESLIKETLKMEEEKFLVLLDRGIKILNEEISKINKILPGEIAFKLCETYGFPIDLNEDILKSKSLKFDKERFGVLEGDIIRECARLETCQQITSNVEKLYHARCVCSLGFDRCSDQIIMHGDGGHITAIQI